MQSLNLNYTIHEINEKSFDEKLIFEVASLTKLFWSEIDFPYPTFPIDHYIRRLTDQPRSDQRITTILIRNEKLNEPIGFNTIFINIGSNSRNNSFIHFFIHPKYRFKGYGKQLFLESQKIIPDYVKIFTVFFRSDLKQNFSLHNKFIELSNKIAIKHSFTGRRSTVYLQNCNLDTISKKALELKMKAGFNGYSLYLVDNIDFSNVPFSRVQFVKLMQDLINDMPREDSQLEDLILNEKDYMNWYKFDKENKMTYWIYIAVDLKTNMPVAMTETRIWEEVPEISYVNDTGVIKAHRGKQLGLTLKYLMLERLLTHEKTKGKVLYWITFNAGSNKHMISINNELQYIESGITTQYEISIYEFQNYLLNRSK
jgi:GNAT superfamily N-acetyltransferase